MLVLLIYSLWTTFINSPLNCLLMISLVNHFRKTSGLICLVYNFAKLLFIYQPVRSTTMKQHLGVGVFKPILIGQFIIVVIFFLSIIYHLIHFFVTHNLLTKLIVFRSCCLLPHFWHYINIRRCFKELPTLIGFLQRMNDLRLIN